MGSIKSFEEIEAWQKARELTRHVYDVTGREPFSSDFGLRNQICRAAVSIMSNIAEGFESQTRKLFVKHLSIAKASAGEVRSQLYVAFDQSYIREAQFEALLNLSKKVSRQIAGFKKYLETACQKASASQNDS